MQSSQGSKGNAQESGDESKKRALACLELASIAVGYKALAYLSSLMASDGSEEIRVLDASPVGARFMLLFTGPTESVSELTPKLRAILDGEDRALDLWIDFEVVEKQAQTIAEALFALPQVEPEEAVVVAECGTVSGLLALAETFAFGHGLKVIELRILRSTTGGAYGFFTGSSAECGPAVANARTRMGQKMRTGRIEMIENTSATFRSFFTLSGNH